MPSPVLTITQDNAVTDMATRAVFNYGYQDILMFEKIAVACMSLIAAVAFSVVVSSIDLGSGKSKTV